MSSQQEVAKCMDVSVRTVRELVNKGIIPPCSNRNQWDLEACTVGYIRHLRQRTNHAGHPDLTAERTRLAAAQANKYEAEHEALMGELVKVDVVANIWTRVLGDLKAKLLSLPTKLAPLVVGKTRAEARGVIENAIHDTLRGLAETAGRDTTGPDPSAEVDSEPVGRRASKTKPRSKRGTRAVVN